VHEHVDAAEGVDCGLDRRLDVLLHADVGRDEAGLAAERRDLGRGPLALLAIDLGDHQASALAREAPRDAAPDPLPRARHDDRPTSLPIRLPIRSRPALPRLFAGT